jgi:hypothetical protein
MSEPEQAGTVAVPDARASALVAVDPDDDVFTRQRSARVELPDPEPLLINLTRCVLEILGGIRDLEQIGRWVTDDVYTALKTRAGIAARARAVKRMPAARPVVTIARVVMTEPCDGIVEAVVIVHGRARSRAVAIRLEGLDHRWRASALSIL